MLETVAAQARGGNEQGEQVRVSVNVNLVRRGVDLSLDDFGAENLAGRHLQTAGRGATWAPPGTEWWPSGEG